MTPADAAPVAPNPLDLRAWTARLRAGEGSTQDDVRNLIDAVLAERGQA
jgi:hypothetical protein